MDLPDLIGETLDGKYQMTRELGRGGMGTVYLATHLGTERPVAVKVIAPQFMRRAEFVERFRREARAAGRLRHPNVVDVTDFGFAETGIGQVAYLVMEYLDGCTLGEILDEERNLPVGWTLDIIEQVCSAVDEAHQQGIIHRDLKPDNIWLEPNQRGGYTVKVLDFGIAKLEEHEADLSGDERGVEGSTLTYSGSAETTVADDHALHTHSGLSEGTEVDDAGTNILSLVPGGEGKTAILPPSQDFEDQDTVGTRLIDSQIPDTSQGSLSLVGSSASADLTRVGAVLGTPLYMSPEQCRGEHLDPRSDIYSIGVITYQMLEGRTPFEGDHRDVMEAHKSTRPDPIRSKGVRRKMKRAIMVALEKDPNLRPQSAEGFASSLRARSEGIFGLLRRSLVIYSEHLPKFLSLSAFFSIPTILISILLLVMAYLKNVEAVSETTAGTIVGVLAMMLTVLSIFVSYLNIGTITWLVTQHLAVPLRPVRLRPALLQARQRWRSFAGTGIISVVLTFVIGILTCGIGFLVLSVAWTLVGPVVMMEKLRGRAALRRSYELVKRSVWTSAAAVLIMFIIPAVIAGSISFVVNITAKALDPTESVVKVGRSRSADTDSVRDEDEAASTEKKEGLSFSFGSERRFAVKTGGDDMRSRLKATFLESLIQLFWLPMQIVVLSFSAIIVALLYLKTRLAGGESMNDLIERFEDDGRPRKKWQERVRQRLIQSGRVSNRTKE